jgi:hypothetical protein
MRRRDARAIAFCIVTSLVVFFGSLLLFREIVASLVLVAAYAIFVFTRPRMRRIRSRLRGDPDWSGYYER